MSDHPFGLVLSLLLALLRPLPAEPSQRLALQPHPAPPTALAANDLAERGAPLSAEVLAQRRSPPLALTALAQAGASLWLGTLDGAVWHVGAGWERLALPETLQPEEGRTRVQALAAASDGALWVATNHGLGALTGERWQAWRAGERGLPVMPLSTLAASPTEAAPLIGTAGAGVVRWTGQRFEPLGEGGPRTITAIAAAGPLVWAGTAHTAGDRSPLWRWDGQRWSGLRLPTTARSVGVNALATQGETLWVGSSAGLFGLTEGSGWVQSPITATVGALATSADGKTLFAMAGQTLWEWNGQAWRSQRLPLRAPVTGLAVHSDGQPRIATLGAGLWNGTRQAVLPAAPRLPVVLVHGYGDSPTLNRSQFRFLARWLQADGWPVVYATGLRMEAPLLANAAHLKAVIATARATYQSDRVLLIGHSFGGLIARTYLGSDLYADDVAGLVTLGTPHAGARFVYDTLLRDIVAGDTRPATVELLPEHTALLDRFLAPRSLPMLAVGGDLVPKGALLAEMPPGDGLISAASATALPGAMARISPLAHGWSVGLLGAGVPSFLFPADFFRRDLAPWLEAVAAGHSPPSEAPEALPPLPEPGQTREVLAASSLAPGDVQRLPFELRRGETIHLFLTCQEEPGNAVCTSDALRFDLQAPDGEALRDDRPTLRQDVAALRVGEHELRPLRLWSLSSAAAGRWEVILTNGGLSAVMLTLDAVRPASPPLQVTVQPGARDEVAVRVSGRPGRLVATLGSEQTPLDGERALVPLPERPGYYPLRIHSPQPPVAGQPGLERWAVAIRPATVATTVERAWLPDGTLAITATLTSPVTTTVAAGLEFGGVRRLSAPRPAMPGSPVEIRWQIAPAEQASLPATSAGVVQPFDARGALLPAPPVPFALPPSETSP